jgi:hypothetical protein
MRKAIGQSSDSGLPVLNQKEIVSDLKYLPKERDDAAPIGGIKRLLSDRSIAAHMCLDLLRRGGRT